jgi:hypothetical protein
MGPKLVQIGFNKSATTALFWLLINSGHSALHSSGRRSRRAGHPVVSKIHPQIWIHHNIAAGLPPLAGLEDFESHFDMEHDVPGSAIKIENFKFFDRFAAAYPDCKFVLNTRDCEAWLRSRARHGGGNYIKRTMARLGLSEQSVLDRWRAEHQRHNDAVREFFLHEADRLFEFELEKQPIHEFVRFSAPTLHLDPVHWGPSRVTDSSA